MSSTVEKISVNLTSLYWVPSLATAAFTRSSTCTSLASLVFSTWKPITGWLLSRAKPRGSLSPSPMEATSDSLTNRPLAVGMVRARSRSTVSWEPSTRTVCSRPPICSRPPG